MPDRFEPQRRRGRGVFRLVCFAVVACTSTPAGAGPSASRKAYEQARKQYFALQASEQRQRYRHNWVKVIAAFTRVAGAHPKSDEAARAVYTTAELWSDLYRISRRGSDLDQALAAYEQVVHAYPDSSLADDALWHRAEIFARLLGHREAAARAVREILARYPKGDMTARATKMARDLADVPVAAADASEPDATATGRLVGRRDDDGGTPTVVDIKHWSNPVYTRVVVYLTGPAHARAGNVAADPGFGATGKPARVFVDIRKAKLSSNVDAEQVVNDDLLVRVRAAQYRTDTVRIVLDLKTSVRHRVMAMENPYRVVVDAFSRTEVARPESVASLNGSLKGHHVVVDPGHGGQDGGAHGPGNILEKNVTLAISKEVARRLEAAGVRVTLTRSDDRRLALEERTAIANRLSADVFVSIHANSNKARKVRGVETYYLDVTDDKYALRLAAVENKISEERVSDLQLILADLATKVNTPESIALAKRVQTSVVNRVKPLNGKIRDLGVKPSLFYVLLGARMPAILVEAGFLSNKQEGRLLGQSHYQKTVAAAVTDAIIEHLKAPPLPIQP
ncbi:MAG: N-acetylmuramoyl-L-alanine amidase [Myxococcota bacterium]